MAIANRMSHRSPNVQWIDTFAPRIAGGPSGASPCTLRRPTLQAPPAASGNAPRSRGVVAGDIFASTPALTGPDYVTFTSLRLEKRKSGPLSFKIIF